MAMSRPRLGEKRRYETGTERDDIPASELQYHGTRRVDDIADAVSDAVEAEIESNEE